MIKMERRFFIAAVSASLSVAVKKNKSHSRYADRNALDVGIIPPLKATDAGRRRKRAALNQPPKLSALMSSMAAAVVSRTATGFRERGAGMSHQTLFNREPFRQRHGMCRAVALNLDLGQGKPHSGLLVARQ